MINRRKFFQTSGAVALGTAVFGSRSFADAETSGTMAPPAGLQLYTVTNKIEEDLIGTLKEIASIGYRELESAGNRKGGYYGLKPKEFAAKVKEFGLGWKAHHATGAFRRPGNAPAGAAALPPRKNLADNYQEIVDDVAEGGVSYLVCSSTPIDTMDDIKRSIDILSRTGEACRKAGIGFAFHNHVKEFEKVDGVLPYDMFLAQISQDILKMELDLAWVTRAGVDPLELFKKYPGRFPLWHVKDLDRVTQRPVEVGAGYVDLARVFADAKTAGLQHIFVEQDAAPKPLENIATSYRNLQKLLAI
jgi:sugar phosphate isomerase/epimerase